MVREEKRVQKLPLPPHYWDTPKAMTQPRQLDYSALEKAAQAFQRFQDAGMHVVRTDQPLDTWEGLRL